MNVNSCITPFLTADVRQEHHSSLYRVKADKAIRASPSYTNGAGVMIEIVLNYVHNLWIGWKYDHMKHFRSISWYTGKHVRPYIHKIILCGHVQTFLLMWVSSNGSSDICCFRFEDSLKRICWGKMFGFVCSYSHVNNQRPINMKNKSGLFGKK